MADRCAVTTSKAGMSVAARLLSDDDGEGPDRGTALSTLMRSSVADGDRGQLLAG
jgi:hypothetical protein